MIEEIVVKINSSAEQVFLFLCSYDKHYTEVSEDHIERVVDIKDANLEHPDVTFYFRQISPISGREQKVRGRVTRVEMNRYIGTEFFWPTSLFLKRVDEVIEPADVGCILTTDLFFTFVAKLFPRSRNKVVEHIRGELEEMRNILEKS